MTNVNGMIIVSLGKGNRAGKAILQPAGFQYVAANAVFGTPSGYFAPDTAENRETALAAESYSVSGESKEVRALLAKVKATNARSAKLAAKQALLEAQLHAIRG